MIENIRKYTGLMIVVFVLLFLGLVFMEGSFSRGYGSGPVMVTANGTGYTEQQYKRLAQKPIRLLRDLSNASFQARVLFFGYLYELGTGPGYPEVDDRLFLVNRLNLQQGAKELGVHASDTEIEEFMRERVFVTPEGDFDQEAYDKFLEDRLPRLGMSSKDLYRILGDVLVYEKIQEIVGLGVMPSRETVRELTENQQQQIDYRLVTFSAATFEANENPGEEEVKTYWEENKARYLSKPKRAFTYVLARPDYTSLLEARAKAQEAIAAIGEESGEKNEEEKSAAASEEDAEDQNESELEEETSQEEETTTPQTPEEEQTPPQPTVESLSKEEREDVILDLGEELDSIWEKIQETEGEQFTALLEAAGYQPVSTEMITEEELPSELQGTVEGVARKAPQVIFRHEFIGASTMERISDVLRIGDNWVVYRIDDIEEPDTLPFEEAREQVRQDLIKESARKAMTAAAEEKRKQLAESLEGGKPFEETAQELELEPLLREQATQSKPFPGEPAPQDLFNLVSKVNPGELSEVLTQNDDRRSLHRAVFAYVDKREVIESDANRNIVEQRYRSAEATMKRLAFSNWLLQKYAASEVSLSGRP